MSAFIAILSFVLGIAVGVGSGFLFSKSFGAKNIEKAKAQARAILKEASVAAEQGKREKLTEAKEEIFKLRQGRATP